MARDFDVGQFLAEVKIRKLLWDVNHELYRNVAEKKNAWAEICRLLFPNFDAKNSKAKQTAENLLKNKWKNARDLFVKRMKAGLIGQARYKNEDDLMFLHEMYNAKLESPSQKSSGVKKSRRKVNTRIENAQPFLRNLRNKTTVFFRQPSGDNAENISSGNTNHRASRCVPVSSKDFAVIEPTSSPSISYRNTRNRSRRKRLQFDQDEAVSSEENETPVEEPSSFVGISDKNTKNSLQRAHKRLKENQNETVALEEYYTVEEPSSSLDTDDTLSVETENENVGLSIQKSLVQSQMGRRLQTCRNSHPSNYLSIVSFPPQEEVDEDIAFFKTLLTWIKKFDENEKLEFRFEVMNLIRRIRNHETV